MENRHWIQGSGQCESPLFRRSFQLHRPAVSAKIQVCGLGYFLLYVNGKRVGDQECMPAQTNYSSVLGCETTYPVWEERTQYRCLYLTFDIKPYLITGENIIGFWLGNGWYHQTQRVDEGSFLFGLPKLRYELTVRLQDGQKIFLESDEKTFWKPSEIVKNNLFYGETHDLRLRREDWCAGAAVEEERRTGAAVEEERCAGAAVETVRSTAGAGDVDWLPAMPVHAPETLLTEQECPPDRVLRRIEPDFIRKSGAKALYDCRENITGRVVLLCTGKAGETVTIRHSEELTKDGQTLNFESAGGSGQIQQDCYILNGSVTTVYPRFCWHGFRYFEVEGPAEVVDAEVIGTETEVISSFRCSNPVLNWLYEAYLRTQTGNYHNAIPSDCPHRERLGYTGDGQLTAETAMLLLDTKQLYEKWYQDILDSQGADSGHIPHTAPFLGGGGGPGGWGCAVYVVPLDFYNIYGDSSLLEKGYPAIIKWLDYMHHHCERGQVVREEAGGWCLGEWCAPQSEQDRLPEAFVNTYYYIRGLEELRNIAAILGWQRPAWIDERLKTSRKSFEEAYFNPDTGDFCGGTGGANAFALRLGMGTAQTRQRLIGKYKALGRPDTGIFGTPVLLEQLFAEGQAELAYSLLTNDSPVSFQAMMKSGATTLWENWEGTQSHNHPMFGSVVKLLFTEILGIRQKKGTCGFQEYEIRPAEIPALTWAEGSLKTAGGTIEVKWKGRLL